ncbi:YdcF family protein [Actinoplanes sp. NPDC020271]|uniref:YdcF family protein n=1 Tax=Actinoplanes sp. NPDC020271 TaxID=3363896 RepID=UPI0037944005
MNADGPPAPDRATDEITQSVDAQAPGLGRADLVFVFGSTLPDAVLPAVDVLDAELAPIVVLTGGPNRRLPHHVESEEHARLLRAHGIAPDQMIIERQSRTSEENVAFARPLIEQRLGAVRTAIAVVKWWQRRQLHVLAAGMPTVERIYAVTWNPPARADGSPYDRTTWADSSDRERIEREHAYLQDLLGRRVLPALVTDGHGWIRADL